MGIFEVEVKVQDELVKIFVIPFEIPDGHSSANYLLIINGLTLGSIAMGENGRWTTEDKLPWDDEDLQIIGDSIGYDYISSVFL